MPDRSPAANQVGGIPLLPEGMTSFQVEGRPAEELALSLLAVCEFPAAEQGELARVFGADRCVLVCCRALWMKSHGRIRYPPPANLVRQALRCDWQQQDDRDAVLAALGEIHQQEAEEALRGDSRAAPPAAVPSSIAGEIGPSERVEGEGTPKKPAPSARERRLRIFNPESEAG